jgi:hypothetical protein
MHRFLGMVTNVHMGTAKRIEVKGIPAISLDVKLTGEIVSAMLPFWCPGFTVSAGPALLDAFDEARRDCLRDIISPQLVSELEGNSECDEGESFEVTVGQLLVLGGLSPGRVDDALRDVIERFTGNNTDHDKDFIVGTTYFTAARGTIARSEQSSEQSGIWFHGPFMHAAELFATVVATDRCKLIDPRTFWLFHAGDITEAASESWPAGENYFQNGSTIELGRLLKLRVATLVTDAFRNAGRQYAQFLTERIRKMRVPRLLSDPEVAPLFARVAGHYLQIRMLTDNVIVNGMSKRRNIEYATLIQARTAYYRKVVERAPAWIEEAKSRVDHE